MKNNFKLKPLIIIFIIAIIALFASGTPLRIFAALSVGDEYKDIYSEYENMNQDINMKGTYEEALKKLFKEVNELNIDTEILQDEIINELGSISSRNNIELSSIKFSEAIPILSDSSGICMRVTVEFYSDFYDMLKFVDEVKNSDTIISVTDISVLTIESGLQVTVNLIFYALSMNYRVQGYETVV